MDANRELYSKLITLMDANRALYSKLITLMDANRELIRILSVHANDANRGLQR